MENALAQSRLLNDLLGSTELAARITALNNNMTENFVAVDVRFNNLERSVDVRFNNLERSMRNLEGNLTTLNQNVHLILDLLGGAETVLMYKIQQASSD